MKSKYKAKKITFDNITFDSKAESDYYHKLKNEKVTGKIIAFDLQPKFTLQEKFKHEIEGNIRAVTYIADFRVIPLQGDEFIVDVKGMATPAALLKRKMFLKVFPHLDLRWVVKSKKYSNDGWTDFFELEKIRRENRKKKAADK